ncbi:MAG: DUF2326 domain-containing protein [Bacteroidetes bacterium]|nr:DUF2326 domain-containing protein [Bacteroidota bacterium]MBU1115022.1 DUF2326 domain-containing protein [Bacteroidota bacterium]MBU1799514.1 DUF2326 domain-containing protein [Bacteroidota bacterium]
MLLRIRVFGDLSILFHAIDNNIKMPRFLIHDGIFDGMDKAHFISVIKYLDEQKSLGKKFQYILALNEEGDLKDNFGDADLVTTQKIEDEAILTLTPSKHLFETDFS